MTRRTAPLSFPQQRLWFLDQVDPASAAYNLVALQPVGAVEAPVLGAALAEIARRHEILRTTFELVDDQPVQSIAAEPEVDFQVVPDAGPEDVAAIVHEQAVRPFDLARGPLLRARLLRLDPQEHALVVATHHIVFDAWSWGIFFAELAELCESGADGRPSSLPPLPLQYADYAERQHERLRGGRLERLLRYWRAQLEGAPQTLVLPTDHTRPARRSGRGGHCWVELPAPLVADLREVAQDEGATTFMALLAGLAALLARFTGRTDVVVGVAEAGRSQRDLTGLIGFFVNTVVHRVDLSARPSFREALRRVRQVTLSALEHAELPFQHLVQELALDRDPAVPPLANVMFVYQRLRTGEVDRAALEAAAVPSARSDLTVSVWEGASSLVADFEYSEDLFAEATVETLARSFVTLLEACAAAPDLEPAAAPLVDGAERARFVARGAGPSIPLGDETLAELVSAQAARTPDAIAVVSGAQRVTFAELDERAAALGRRLTASGAGPDTRVAVVVERSVDLVAALLAVAKAGAAYVPVDPQYPRDRIALMLEDARPVVVLTQRALAHLLPETDAQVVLLEEPAGGENAAPAALAPLPRGLAYVIYTSGSTGRPKGVAIEQRALVAFLRAMEQVPGLRAGDVLVAVTSVSFDIAALELFLPLLVGTRVVVCPRETAADGAALAALLDAEGATTMQATPATWKLLVEAGWRGRPGFRALCGGEALPRWLAEELLARGLEVWNLYGPTETTIWSTVDRVEPGPVTIGGPIANTTAYVLDDRLEPVPRGALGELYLGGAGVARGYWDLPATTAERFVPDPFGTGGRLYATGDLVRSRADGRLEFHGRRDRQVKVRGYRVEPGEIEAALVAHPAVQDAAVVVRDDQLAAFLVASAPLPPPSELTELLARSLPAYMLPNRFVRLEALPLTPNGKVDRDALRVDGGQAIAGGAEAPRTATEELVAEMWRELLDLEEVGADESFFAVGGHSLLAAQLLARIRARFGVALSVHTLFERPTIAGLAAALAETPPRSDGDAVPELRGRTHGDVVPLSFEQERSWLLEELLGEPSAFTVSSHYTVEGPVDVDALAAAVAEIVRRHETLRTTFHDRGAELVAHVEPAVDAPLEVTDLGAAPESARDDLVDEVVAEMLRDPFDTTRGPLFRVRLLRLAPDEHVVVVVMHHIVSDEWSLGVFFDELVALHDAFAAGAPSPLPPLSVQYPDYAAWQREWLGGGRTAELVRYWRGKLEGAPQVLELPTDRPRPPVQTFGGAHWWVELPAALVATLQAAGRRHDATLFMTMLAAFAALLARYTGRDDVVVGTYVSGRDQLELEPLIGFFVNTLPLRLRLDDDPTVAEIVARTRTTTLEAFEHRELPFEILLEELRVPRDPARTPVFQAMFVHQNAMEATRPSYGDRPPTAAVVVPRGPGTETRRADFDLTLDCWPAGDGMMLDFVYNVDLFEQATIEAMARAYVSLLEHVCRDSTSRLSRLPLAAEAPKALPGRRRSGDTLVSTFRRQVERAPDAQALVWQDGSLAYADLWRRASAVAAALAAEGAGPETVVGVTSERSGEQVVALLGASLAGAAFLPLDPALPPPRLAATLENAAPRAVLADARLRTALPDGAPPTLAVEADFPDGEAPPSATARPSNLAYLVYTSGSTGEPKGVAVAHESILPILEWSRREFAFGLSTRTLQLLSPAFDFGIYEILLTLLYGGTLHVFPDAATDPELLADYVAAHGITALHATPTLASLLLTRRPLPRLELLHLGGESLSWELVDVLRAQLPACRIVNGYGPTENSVNSTLYDVPRGGRGPTAVVPIGSATAETAAFVLDDELRPLPPGAVGELYLGGPGLARGYQRRPALTAERFLPDPHGDGARVYRTGDRVRGRHDGTIEFLGRVDDQVKIRGYRIELADVEAALRRHREVADVAVAVEGADDEALLVAYVVPRDPASPPAPSAFLDEARAWLPAYMVPARATLIADLPLNTNGKVDRARLGETAPLRARSPKGRPPRTPEEQALAALWASVLELEEIRADDNFFELGGNSLRAYRLVARIRSELGAQLPLRTFLLRPTVEAQARALETLVPGRDTVPLRRIDRERHAVLTGDA